MLARPEALVTLVGALTVAFNPTGTTDTTSIETMALTDTVPVTLWTGSDSPDTLQVDATNVYFTTQSGALWKLSPK